jgi:hypothetical protein
MARVLDWDERSLALGYVTHAHPEPTWRNVLQGRDAAEFILNELPPPPPPTPSAGTEADHDDDADADPPVPSVAGGGAPAPDWLLRPVLGNAWDLPPEALLCQMSGGCLPVRFEAFCRRRLDWQKADSEEANAAAALAAKVGSAGEMPAARGGGLFAAHRVCSVRRRAPPAAAGVGAAAAEGGIPPLAESGMHCLQLRPAIERRLNGALAALALQRERESPGISVSNVGGWHSGRDMHRWQDGAAAALSAVFERAVAMVEQHECALDSTAVAAARCSRPPCLADMPADSWLNISRRGNWNKLHTHEGSFWSGVYYVAAPPPEEDEGEAVAVEGGGGGSSGGGDGGDGVSGKRGRAPLPPRPRHHATVPPARGYSGSLLLRPKTAPGEVAVTALTDAERARIRAVVPGTAAAAAAEAEQAEADAVPPAVYSGVAWHGTAEYYEVQAQPGMLLLFPSWLLHCVLPLYCEGGGGGGGDGGGAAPVRISAAYNFDLKT